MSYIFTKTMAKISQAWDITCFESLTKDFDIGFICKSSSIVNLK